jgi:hypothetical protein
MISRENFVFTIGFDGDAAMVDKRAKARYRGLSTMELAKVGLFRAAYASAVFGNDQKSLEEFLAYYNSVAGTSVSVSDDVNRLFGVYRETITKTIEL